MIILTRCKIQMTFRYAHGKTSVISGMVLSLKKNL